MSERRLFPLVGKYANAVGKHGPDSAEVRQIRQEHADDTEFLGYADALDRIKRTLSKSPLVAPPAEVERLREVNAELLAALRRVQHIAAHGFTYCAVCKYVEEAGHATDCCVGNAIAKAAGQGEPT